MRSRTATAAVGVVVSLAISVAAWYYLDTLLVFLVLPFVPILFRGRGNRDSGADPDRSSTGAPPVTESASVGESPPVRECPRCGFRTRAEEFRYCPRDGTRLEARSAG